MNSFTRQLSSTSYPIPILMLDSTDHITGKTGLTLTVTISKNGGAFGAAAGAVSEVGNGLYMLGGNATDRNTLGTSVIRATAIGAEMVPVCVDIVTHDEFAMPAAVADAVWDEVLTGATHNIATSAGRRLRGLQDFQGYSNGAIWIDTINGTAGTTNYENGTVENPVNSIADANTLATSLGFTRFQIAPASSLTFAVAQNNQEFHGDNWTLNLNGQSVSGTHIHGATVSGNDDGSNASATHYTNCVMGSNTLGLHTLEQCGLSGTITLAEAGTYDWITCHSRIAGIGTPGVDVGVAIANTNLNMRRYSGGIEVQNIGQAGVDNMSLEGNGQLILNANCAGGTIAIRGHFTVTDNAGGVVTLADNARYDTFQINAQCDTALSDYDGPTNAEMEARTISSASADKLELSAGTIVTGAAVAGTLSTTQMTTNLTEATDDHYNGRVILWTSGNLQNQATAITDYDGGTKMLTYTAVTEAPVATDSFVIV